MKVVFESGLLVRRRPAATSLNYKQRRSEQLGVGLVMESRYPHGLIKIYWLQSQTKEWEYPIELEHAGEQEDNGRRV